MSEKSENSCETVKNQAVETVKAAKPKKIGLRLKILLFILIVLTNFAVTLFACNIKLEEIVITLRSNNNFMKNQYQMSSD